MAKLDSSKKFTHSRLGEAEFSYVQPGEFRIKSAIDPRHWSEWVFKLNGHTYSTGTPGDISNPVFDLGYNGYSATGKPDQVWKDGGQPYTYWMNPITPLAPKYGNLVVDGDPHNKLFDMSATVYQKIKDNNLAGWDEEYLAVTVNYNLRDNVFNRCMPVVSIEGSGNSRTVKVKMASTFTGTHYTSTLPDLYRKGDLYVVDDQDVAYYDKTNMSYNIPWIELQENEDDPAVEVNSTREYVLRPTVDSPGFSGEKVSATFNYEAFNSVVYFNMATYDVKNLSRNGQTLSWKTTGDSFKTCNSFAIYVDGVFRENVSGTSWKIPDELYNGQYHNYSIKANREIDTRYRIKYCRGTKEFEDGVIGSTELQYPAIRRTEYYVRDESAIVTDSSWANVGSLKSPRVTATRDSKLLNKYTMTITKDSDDVYEGVYYQYILIGTQEYKTSDSGVVVFSNLKVNTTYSYNVYTAVTLADGTVRRCQYPTKIEFTPAKYPAPGINSSYTKTAINAYEIKFSTTHMTPDRYDVFLNGKLFRRNATSPLIISGLTCNATNTIKVESVFEADNSYNNSRTVTLEASYTPPLTAPTLTKTDVKENNYTDEFGESSEILNNVTTAVDLKWNALEFASGYVIYDDYRVYNNDTQSWEEGTRVYPTQTDTAGTEYMQTTSYRINMDNVLGYHDYSVKAIAAVDETYNSGKSNEISLEQNFPLDAPVMTADSTSTTIAITNKISNADFYSIQLVPTRGTTQVLFRSFIPKDNEFPYSYNYYDMIKDLTETESFIVSTFSRSYNAFYFHPSADSNQSSVDVIKLAKPVNLNYDDATGKLTWTGDSNAYRYQINIKATDGDWATYYTDKTEFTFEDLAPALYTIYIVAERDDSKTNNKPVYLDSVKSDNLSFGILNVPKNFSRYINTFSWDSVGADKYVFYEDGISLTTIDGGGTSLELGMDAESKYRPTEGTHTYQVQAVTTIDGVGYKSLLTDPITVNIEYLPSPVISFIKEGGTLSSNVQWDDVHVNVVYDTRINNIQEKDPTNDTTYYLNKDEAGFYYIKTRAISTVDEFLYQTSEFSNEIRYDVFQLPRPEIKMTIVENPDAYDDYTFTWEPIEFATSYTLTITKQGEGATEYPITSGTSYMFAPTAGNYSVFVKANGSITTNPNPKYITSNSSNIINFGKLESPAISITENIVSWEADELADYYEIYNYGKYFSQTENNLFELSVDAPYSYSIRVKAVSNNPNLTDSDLSNTIEYEVIQLNTPQNLTIKGNVLNWDLVLNAEYYTIYIANAPVVMTSETTFDMTKIFEEQAGILTLYVTANSNKINYLQSEPSNYILKRIEKQKKFNIVIDGINYDQIQLPFSISETLDESLDTAGVILGYIDRKEPFERETPAYIVIYEDRTASKTYKMIIESDDVSEVQVGNTFKYKHTLQLIERTLILQREVCPDFTVSTSIIENLRFKKNNLITPTYGGNKIPNRSMFGENLVATGTYNEYRINFSIFGYEVDFTIPLGFVFFFGLGDNITGRVKSQNVIGESFALPMTVNRLGCWHFSIQEYVLSTLYSILNFTNITFGVVTTFIDVIKAIVEIVNTGNWWKLLDVVVDRLLPVVGDINSATLTDDEWPFPARNYYIRPHHDGYAKTSDETLIASTPDSLTLRSATYTFTEQGNYDLIVELPPVNFQKLYNENMLGEFTADFFEGSGDETLPTAVNFMKDEDGNAKPFRVVWHNLNALKVVDHSKPMTIAEVLEKVCVLMDNRYKIDPTILSLTAGMDCPDLTFSNGNYLYDVLEKIGREFNGIPRLLEDNVITFDILDTYTAAQRNLTRWTDKNVLESRAQDLDNVSSGFISRVQNMVPEEDSTIYPAPGMWIGVRAEDSSVAAVSVSTIGIHVDKPIYKINRVLIKNAIKEQPEMELDITNYVYESTVYDALNNDRYGKGLALVWTQGDNLIRGLGQLPENSKFYAAMGWQSDTYVIQEIVKHVIGFELDDTLVLTPNDPPAYLFNIEYQGYNETMFYVENPDNPKNKYSMYNVFNQDENTISDVRFGNAALIQIKRHGGEVIQKNYRSYSVAQIPLLGCTIKEGIDTYYIDQIKYTFQNNYIDASASFTKNYNKINPRMGVNSEYRQYELQANDNVNRVTSFNQYCMVGNYDSRRQYNAKWNTILKNNFNGVSNNKPDSFYFNCYNDNSLSRLPYVTTDIDGNIKDDNIPGIALPVNYFRIGTSVSFSTNMEDAFCAGRYVIEDNNKEIDLGMVQRMVRYVGDDSQNQVPYMRVSIASLPNFIKNKNASTYPAVDWLSSPTTTLSPLFTKQFRVYKDQRERLMFNYQMHFISNRDDIKLNRGFTRYMFKNPNKDAINTKPILIAFNGEIGEKDIFTYPYQNAGEVIVNDNYISFHNKTVATTNYDNMAVIWSDTKEVIMEIKKPTAKGENISYGNIYFNFSDSILK